ncbi:hypothetical protein [Sporosarcina sp. FSL K6-1508]|uniref:hypothetical protein n=1 Tax=Sporosarcina sp. FSL K6-1508 TaxID=2921553 RepID=UPI0030F8F1DB
MTLERGLYCSGRNLLINADVNGAANILKKALYRLTKETDFNIETVNVWNSKSIVK